MYFCKLNHINAPFDQRVHAWLVLTSVLAGIFFVRLSPFLLRSLCLVPLEKDKYVRINEWVLTWWGLQISLVNSGSCGPAIRPPIFALAIGVLLRKEK